MNVLLAAIGEQLENEGDNEVMGVVVNTRKAFYRIGLWTRSSGNKSAPGNKRSPDETKNILEKIGERFKDLLQLNPNEVVEFMGHSDSAHAGSSRAKAKFSV